MTLLLDDQLLMTLYPAFIRTDLHGTLIDFGPSIGRHVPDAAPGAAWGDSFRHVGPGCDADSLRSGDRQQAVRILDLRAGHEFTGLLVRAADVLTYLLTPSPSIDGLVVEDFAPGDNQASSLVTVSLLRTLLEESGELVCELAEARRVAEAALMTQTRFLNGISHQLRTPMASLCLYATPSGNLGCAEDLLNPRAYDALMSLKSKIDNLIDYTALCAGDVRSTPQWCAAERLTGAVRYLEQRAGLKGLGLRWTEEGLSGRQVRIDPSLLDRLLDNLIGDAIENSGEGEIRVNLALAAGRCLRVTVSGEGCRLGEAREAAGLGVGWTARQTSEQRQGLGISLAICGEIATIMGGGLTTTSSGQGGTAFTFEAPVEVR